MRRQGLVLQQVDQLHALLWLQPALARQVGQGRPVLLPVDKVLLALLQGLPGGLCCGPGGIPSVPGLFVSVPAGQQACQQQPGRSAGGQRRAPVVRPAGTAEQGINGRFWHGQQGAGVPPA